MNLLLCLRRHSGSMAWFALVQEEQLHRPKSVSPEMTHRMTVNFTVKLHPINSAYTSIPQKMFLMHFPFLYALRAYYVMALSVRLSISYCIPTKIFQCYRFVPPPQRREEAQLWPSWPPIYTQSPPVGLW